MYVMGPFTEMVKTRGQERGDKSDNTWGCQAWRHKHAYRWQIEGIQCRFKGWAGLMWGRDAFLLHHLNLDR